MILFKSRQMTGLHMKVDDMVEAKNERATTKQIKK